MSKLQIFDLDDTLFRIPTFSAVHPTEAESKYGLDPYKFYDSAESLDFLKYTISLIEPVYEEYIKEFRSIQHLITHRVQNLSSELNTLLNAANLKFNYISMLGRVGSKADIVNKKIHESLIGEIKHIEIFEDSFDQILNYKQNLILESDQQLTFWLVDKSKVFKLDNQLQVQETKRIKLRNI